MGVDQSLISTEVLELLNKLIQICQWGKTPEFLIDNKYWKSFRELYGIMGPDCVLLNKIATLMYTDDYPTVKAVLHFDIPTENNG